jgi:AcrR family transcriptional regulator
MEPDEMPATPKRRRPAQPSEPSAATDPDLARLWGITPAATRGPKPGLSLERIVRAAIDIAAAEGLAEVSMRRVAKAVGFTTMSLYRYVRSKDELADQMLDALIGPPPALDTVPGGWRPKLERWAREEWAVLRRYPWLLQLITTRPSFGPNRMAWLETALRALAPTSLPPLDRLEVVRLLDRYIRGAAQDPPFASDLPPRARETWLAAQHQLLTYLATNPNYQTLSDTLITAAQTPSPPDDLTFGLHRLLDGVEHLMEPAPKKRPR